MKNLFSHKHRPLLRASPFKKLIYRLMKTCSFAYFSNLATYLKFHYNFLPNKAFP